MSNISEDRRGIIDYLTVSKELIELKVERSIALLVSGEHDESIACNNAAYVGKDGMCYQNFQDLEKADNKYNEEKPNSLFKML